MLELGGIHRKIRRALTHRMELNRVIQSFFQSNPYRLFVEPNIEEGYEIIRVGILKQPPAEIGVIVGDIAHNLRSALDHLACQFIIGNGNSPSSAAAFPIFREDPKTTEKTFSKWNAMTKGMAPDAIRFIDDCQPYKIRHLPNPHHLSLLSALSNWDKHRDIHAVGHYAGGLDFNVEGPFIEYREQPLFTRIEDQVELCRFKTPQQFVGAKTKLQLWANFSLCFDSPKRILNSDPIEYLLERIWTYVASDVVEWVSGSFHCHGCIPPRDGVSSSTEGRST